MSSNNQNSDAVTVAVSSSDTDSTVNDGRTLSSGNSQEENEDEVSSTSACPPPAALKTEGDKNEGISSSADVAKPKNDAVVFAQPNLPPPLKSRSSNERKEVATPSSSTGTPSSSSSAAPQKEKISREKLDKYNAIISSLKYYAPTFGAPQADPRYNLEVLKNGAIVDSVKFNKEDSKGYYVIGRIPGCDIVAENPTVSRLHAILQFVQAPPKEDAPESNAASSDASDNPQETGLYIFDLNSTHGTFINKNQVFPKRYYRVHVGHVLKFGSSQRMYIVNGPSEDEEEESDKSVTELMNEKLAKDLERKKLEEEEQLKRGINSTTVGSKLPKENIEQEGIDWGMGEDADEGSDMKINPFAMDYEASELTLDNPKKTLRSWFDREGYDLEYEMREKGNGQYVCRIPLPLDGPTDAPVFAESEVRGKKKEAAHDAALKACKILDSHGLLKASKQDTRKRKERRYEDEDYYSSDEDTFLDRTGTIEKKREKRMRLAGKVEEKVETYETLSAKYSELESEIKYLKSRVEKSQETQTRADEGDIDLDDYMNMLKSGTFDVKKLKSRLKEATEEMQRTKKLMDIAKPADLPSYLRSKPREAASSSSSVTQSSKTEEEKESMPSPQTSSSDQDKPPTAKVEDDESPRSQIYAPSQQPIKKPMVGPMKPPPQKASGPPQPKLYGLIKPSELSTLKLGIRPDEERPAISLKDELEEEDEEGGENSSSNDEDDEQKGKEDAASSSSSPVAKKKKRQRYRNKYRKQPSSKSSEATFDDPKYSTWVPPKNQTGDGRTSLNEKLGY